MGRRGPPKKPADHVEKRGNPGHRPMPDVQQQQEKADSAFVLPNIPPAWLRDKDARAIYAAVYDMTRTTAHPLLRDTDADFVARYCWKAARLHRSMSKPIRDTYETRSTTGAKIIKRNPAYDALLELEKAVKVDEDRMGFNPRARLDIFSRLAASPSGQGLPAGKQSRKPPGTSDQQSVPPNTPPMPSSPFGILTSHPPSKKH